jgi:hypothetical protein
VSDKLSGELVASHPVGEEAQACCLYFFSPISKSFLTCTTSNFLVIKDDVCIGQALPSALLYYFYFRRH